MKITNKTITEHIDTDYRDYALYILESRGIPNFYDSITPVQRFIVQNAPLSYTKTNTLVGDCISDGYHHGSLEDSITTVARDYLCANNILDGRGFFGNPINTKAASARYTSVKINSKTKEIIKKYSALNERDIDGAWHPLKVDIPFGLCVSTWGIAIGYRCVMLPRKLEDIQEYLDGKRKYIKPYLMGYPGKILKNKDKQNRSSWIIHPVIDVSVKSKSIHIQDVSPTIKYSTFINKINKLIDEYQCRILNNSRERVDIKLKFNRNLSEGVFKEITNKIESIATATFTETIILIKDKVVLEYDKVESYLDDFKNYREFLYRDWYQYEMDVFNDELEYLKAKVKYLQFMMEKKRTKVEVEGFLNGYKKNIYSRLDSIKLRFLNKEVLIQTKEDIKELKENISKKKKTLSKQKKKCKEIKNVTENANKNIN